MNVIKKTSTHALSFAAMLIAISGFFACGGKKNDPTPTSTATVTPIVGTWHIKTAIDYGGNLPYTMTLSKCDSTANYIFSANGAFNITLPTNTGCVLAVHPITGGSYANVLNADPLSAKDDQGNVILSSKQVVKANDGSGAEFFSAGPWVFTNSSNTVCSYYTEGILLTLTKQ